MGGGRRSGKGWRTFASSAPRAHLSKHRSCHFSFKVLWGWWPLGGGHTTTNGEQPGLQLQPGLRAREQARRPALWGEPVQQGRRAPRPPAQPRSRSRPWCAQPSPPAPHPPAVRGGRGNAGSEQFSGKPAAGRSPGAQFHFAQQPQLRVRPPLPTWLPTSLPTCPPSCRPLQPANHPPHLPN